MKLPWVPRHVYDLTLALYERQASTIRELREANDALLAEVRDARQQHGSMMSEAFGILAEMKRDGLVYNPNLGPTIDRASDGLDTAREGLGDALPDLVLEAIEERSRGQVPQVRRDLVSYARKEVKARRVSKMDEDRIADEVAAAVLNGERLD